MQFHIKTKSKKSMARTGIITTPHGNINTPYLIPVATAATVRGLDQKDMESLGAEVLLANTYHLHLKPGEKTIKKLRQRQKKSIIFYKKKEFKYYMTIGRMSQSEKNLQKLI